ncbi:hypothetical protein ACHWQZ_G011168 [Mnemiopsis leidyi]
MTEDDLESQKDEILALQSIYDNREFRTNNETQGIFTANVQLPLDTVQLILPDQSAVPNCLKHLSIFTENKFTYNVKYLPPIVLKFEYQLGYPSSTYPKFSLSCLWLPDDMLQRVRQQLIDDWEGSRDVILFSWTSFLVNDIWDFLLLPNKLICPEFISSDMISDLCVFDYEKRLSVFKQSPHKCNVCFEEYKGSLCMQFLPCDHVFCKVCMKSYFEVMIASGDVNQLLCPNDKCDSVALPTQVKELVETDLYERYEKFLLQRTLDQMSDVVRCPRKFCQNSVLKDVDSNMAQCNSCNFIFCVLCDKTWHGEHTPCEIRSSKYLEMYEKWKNSSEPEREALYKMYGRANVLRIVADIDSAEWLKINCKLCPHCSTPLQLGTGCNKIRCSVCGKFMCWLCGQKINHNDPYSHFRPGGPCENRLFENTVTGFDEDLIFNDNADNGFQFVDNGDDDWIEIVFQE